MTALRQHVYIFRKQARLTKGKKKWYVQNEERKERKLNTIRLRVRNEGT